MSGECLVSFKAFFSPLNFYCFSTNRRGGNCWLWYSLTNKMNHFESSQKVICHIFLANWLDDGFWHTLVVQFFFCFVFLWKPCLMCFSSNFLSRVQANLFKAWPKKSLHIYLRRRNPKNSRISIYYFIVTTHKLGLRGRGHHRKTACDSFFLAT